MPSAARVSRHSVPARVAAIGRGGSEPLQNHGLYEAAFAKCRRILLTFQTPIVDLGSDEVTARTHVSGNKAFSPMATPSRPATGGACPSTGTSSLWIISSRVEADVVPPSTMRP